MRNNQKRLGAQPQAVAAQAPPTGLTFEVPTEFVELPSRGKFYPADHPLHNQKTIEVKLMTTKEEDILASSALIKAGVVLERLMESIIVQDIDPKTLFVGDRNAIMIAARISAYGSAYKTQVECNKCGTVDDFTFDLKKLNFSDLCFDEKKMKELSVSWNKDLNLFEFMLPKAQVLVGVKIPTGEEENTEEVKNNIVTESLKTLLYSVNGNTDPTYISSFVDNMLAWDSRELRKVIPLVMPNVDLKQEYFCEACFNRDIREVPLSAEFFWPR